jgi:hypothetical protein
MIGDGPMPGRYIVWLLTVTYVLARGGGMTRAREEVRKNT